MSEDTPPFEQRLLDHIRLQREERAREYKGARGREGFTWDSDRVRAKVARAAMAMANIGGGVIVIGMDEVGPDRWVANGIPEEHARSLTQDQVLQYVNQKADPSIALTVRHIPYDGKRFVIIEVEGFDELPVVCKENGGNGETKQGAVYSRSRAKYESAQIQRQDEMRELLDRAIEAGLSKRLRPILETVAAMHAQLGPREPEGAERFAPQRGDE